MLDENGHLQCSYHGWSFDGCGSCTRIPQAAFEGRKAKVTKSPRACATKCPTMVSQGLLFVWLDENGWEKAHATNSPHVIGRRDRAKPLPFKMESSGPWGFSGANLDSPKISAKFIAPCYYLNK